MEFENGKQKNSLADKWISLTRKPLGAVLTTRIIVLLVTAKFNFAKNVTRLSFLHLYHNKSRL